MQHVAGWLSARNFGLLSLSLETYCCSQLLLFSFVLTTKCYKMNRPEDQRTWLVMEYAVSSPEEHKMCPRPKNCEAGDDAGRRTGRSATISFVWRGIAVDMKESTTMPVRYQEQTIYCSCISRYLYDIYIKMFTFNLSDSHQSPRNYCIAYNFE